MPIFKERSSTESKSESENRLTKVVVLLEERASTESKSFMEK